MTATVQLTDEEIKDLCELTRIDNAEGAVRSALDEYRRYARRIRLKELSGQVTMEESWQELEAAETSGVTVAALIGKDFGKYDGVADLSTNPDYLDNPGL